MASYSPIVTPPPVLGSYRARHTRLRIRMLTGQWQPDLQKHMREAVGPVRSAALGSVMLSACPLRDLAHAVSVLYDTDVALAHPSDNRAAAQVQQRWDTIGARASLQAAQVWTEGLNECGRQLYVDEETGRMRVRVVTPDLLDGKADPIRPGVPVEMGEWCLRTVGTREMWVREVYSVADPAAPYYRVEDTSGDDITEAVHGRTYEGGDYPAVYRYADGRPFLPWSLTHSMAEPAALFTPWHRVETVDGTMLAARQSSIIDDAMTHAAWPQRAVFNMQPAGTRSQQADDGSPVQVQVGDPKSILMYEAGDDETQPMQWQWDTAAPIGEMQDVYERRLAMLAQSWGLNPSDLVRASADARSGVALSLSRAGVREVQQRRAPVYRPHDERLAAMTAAVMNRLDGGTRPEGGYRVAYGLLPLSVGEQKQIKEDALDLLERGLLSPAEARARVLGESIEAARLGIARIATARTAEEAQ